MAASRWWQRSTARRSWLKLLRGWESLQVELHGKYSAERMYHLKDYSDNTSVLHALAVLVLTPVPCLIAVTLLDCMPLRDPSEGLKSSHVFWLRAFVMTWFTLLTVLEQLRRFIVNLPISMSQIMFISAFVSTGSTAWAYAVAVLVGFPVPFTIAVGAPVCCSLLALCFVIGWGKFLRENPLVKSELMNFAVIVTTQVGLTYVYPAYNYAFVNLPPSSQTAFALLLPVLKLLMKNWLSYIVRHMEDFKPEVVIFNVEIFHALYVACCMQRSTSRNTTILLMGMDFLQAMASIYDVNSILRSIVRIEKRIETSRALSRRSNRPEAATGPHANPGTVVVYSTKSKRGEADGDDEFQDEVDDFSAAPKSIPLLDTVQYLIEKDDEIRRHSSIRLESATRAKLSDVEKRGVDSLSPTDRLKYVQQMLQLLHLTEFVILVEFTEVIIPVVYCLYLLVMGMLPNRVYYAQLKSESFDTLLHTVGNILVYALLEVVSFMLLSLVLSRKLQISPIHQLAFVLETQWQLVQSKLVLWVVFSVQSSLYHFGADYSFQFKWLRAGHQA